MNIVYFSQIVWVIICAFGGIFYGRSPQAIGGPFGAGLATLLAMVFGCILISILLAPSGYRPL